MSADGHAPGSVDALSSRSSAERAAACRALAEHPNAVFWLEALVARLGDPMREVRRAASDALAGLGEVHEEARSRLRDALRGDDARARLAAVHALSKLDPPTMAWLPALAPALGATDADERWAAGRLWVEVARVHGEAATALAALASGAELELGAPSQAPAGERTQRMALLCLREFAPADPRTHRILTAATHSESSDVRRAALSAIAGLRSREPETEMRLIEVLGSGDTGSDAVERRLAAEPPERRLAADPAEQRLAAEPVERRLAADPVERRLAADPVERRLAADPAERRLAAVALGHALVLPGVGANDGEVRAALAGAARDADVALARAAGRALESPAARSSGDPAGAR